MCNDTCLVSFVGKGDFTKNMESLKDGNIAITAAKSKVSGSWLPCTNCMFFYSAKTLGIHVRRCTNTRSLLPAE